MQWTEQAFAAFRAEGDDVRAAVCARFVGYLHWVLNGNGAAMSGWLARAVCLVEAAGDRPERTRIELTRATVTADPEARDSDRRAGGTLTAREQEVVELLCQGVSNAEVEARLYVSPRTAEHYVSNILAKRGLRTRSN